MPTHMYATNTRVKVSNMECRIIEHFVYNYIYVYTYMYIHRIYIYTHTHVYRFICNAACLLQTSCGRVLDTRGRP